KVYRHGEADGERGCHVGQRQAGRAVARQEQRVARGFRHHVAGDDQEQIQEEEERPGTLAATDLQESLEHQPYASIVDLRWAGPLYSTYSFPADKEGSPCGLCGGQR